MVLSDVLLFASAVFGLSRKTRFIIVRIISVSIVGLACRAAITNLYQMGINYVCTCVVKMSE